MNKHPESYRLNRPWIRIALLAFLVIVTCTFLAFQIGRSGLNELAPNWSLDYRQYWGASRVLGAGGDPYNVTVLTRMEATTGVLKDLPVMMWNPPWTLVLALPFAALPFGLSALVWLIVSILIVLGCGIALWGYYGLDRRFMWLGAVTAVASYPVFWGLQYGQSHAWLLLGITGFLVSQRAKRDLLAGAAVAILSIKPHVTFLFLACVVWWMLRERRWRVLVGGAVTLLAMCIIVGVISPSVFAQYLDAMRRPPIYWQSATLGTWLRILIGFEYPWLQFVPTIIGTAAFIVWILWSSMASSDRVGKKLGASMSATWSWHCIAPWSLLASALTAPYGWTFDKIILLPVVFAYLCRSHNLPRWHSIVAGIAYLGAQIGLFIVLQGTELGESVNYAYPVLICLLYIWQQRVINKRLTPVKEHNYAPNQHHKPDTRKQSR